MCTLTYIPIRQSKSSFIITDNRDEAVNRPADFPQIYKEMNTELFYPRDTRAGGTWFGVGQKNRAMALLNGAFKRHTRKTTYRKSRGLVVKELLATENLKVDITRYDFSGIEAFFGVIFSWEDEIQILEIIWDEKELFLQTKNPEEALIWSSAMTFSPEEHQKKEKTFQEFIDKNHSSEAVADLIWNFHQSEESGMVLDFGILKTTSISQFRHQKENDFFRYRDLITEEEQEDMIFWK